MHTLFIDDEKENEYKLEWGFVTDNNRSTISREKFSMGTQKVKITCWILYIYTTVFVLSFFILLIRFNIYRPQYDCQ